MINMMTTPFLLATLLAQPSQNINDYVQNRFEDAQFVAKVGTANFTELKKINQDFSQSYRFKSSQVWLKEPFMLKMVSTVEDTQITFLVSGGMKYTRIPRSNINLKENVSKAPGKRQTPFDFGILAPSLVRELFDAKFVRLDRATNDVVFDLTYKPALKDSSRHRVWIDADRKIITKREWYGQLKRSGGRLMATFVYDNPKQEGGMIINTKVTVYNAENKMGGSVSYDDMKINRGISDSVFVLK